MSVTAVTVAERGTGVEERQLAEHLAGAEDRQQVLAAVGGGAPELHLAVGDDVQLVPGVTLVEEHLAAAQPHRAQRALQRSGRLVVQGAEQRRLTQHIGIHEPSSFARSPSGPQPSRGRQQAWPESHPPLFSPVARAEGAGRAKSLRPPGARRLAPVPDTALVRRARKVDRTLAATYPDARCELDFSTPFELLVVTVLSAQTTDRRVNGISPALFAAYPDATRDGRRGPGADRDDHRADRLLPGQDRVAAQALPGPRRALRRRGARAGSRTSSPCPAWAARPPTWCSATPSGSPG